MKITSRCYVPTGRTYEMIEVKYEDEAHSSQECDMVEKMITELAINKAKELFHCLKDTKPINEGDIFTVDGVLWKREHATWKFSHDGKEWHKEK